VRSPIFSHIFTGYPPHIIPGRTSACAVTYETLGNRSEILSSIEFALTH